MIYLIKLYKMDYSEKEYSELVAEEKRLSSEDDEIMESCIKEGLSFSEYCKKAQDVREKLFFIDKYIRLKKDPIITYGKEWSGNLLELDKFKLNCEKKIFTDSEGVGYYATENSKSNIEILPSDFEYGLVRSDFTHVVWFDK